MFFFSIPLHPEDVPQFAFLVPSINRQKSLLKIFHWTVLPQGMRNSLTVCQWYVVKILSPVCGKFPQSTILNYMDDIFIATKDNTALQIVAAGAIDGICKAGLSMAEEKMQQSPPWKYLQVQTKQVLCCPPDHPTAGRPNDAV